MWGGRESTTWKVTLDDDHVVEHELDVDVNDDVDDQEEENDDDEHELDVDVVVTDAFYRKRQNSRYA